MGRYETETTDKAEKLEKWVQEIAKKMNKEINDAKIYDIGLVICKPFTHNNTKYFNGFVGVYIEFDKKEPEFLTIEDKILWWPQMKQSAKNKFDTIDITAINLDSANIPFKEPSEEELYILTPNKANILKSGFENIKKYIGWYSAVVRQYDLSVVQEHKKRLLSVVQEHKERMQSYLDNLEDVV